VGEFVTFRLLCIVLSIFTVKEVKDTMLKKQYMDFQLAACPITDKVVIKSIGKDVCREEIELYFEDKRNCPDGGDVLNVEVFDNGKSAIVQFQDHSGMCYFNVYLPHTV